MTRRNRQLNTQIIENRSPFIAKNSQSSNVCSIIEKDNGAFERIDLALSTITQRKTINQQQ